MPVQAFGPARPPTTEMRWVPGGRENPRYRVAVGLPVGIGADPGRVASLRPKKIKESGIVIGR